MTSDRRTGETASLLVFEDGDVIFHTSAHPSGIFVLHKDILVSKSGYFRGILSDDWGKTAKIRMPGTVPAYELDLQLDCELGFALPVPRVSEHPKLLA